MQISSFEAVASARNLARVRYLVAGGLAVNAHGYIRLTRDMGLVVKLDRENTCPPSPRSQTLGYRPLVPVSAEQFADPAQREAWIRDKGMQVLNLHSELHRTATVDIFVTEPFDFEMEYRAALQAELLPGTIVRFVSIPTLIAMKRLAGRARDLDDIEHLSMLDEEQRKR